MSARLKSTLLPALVVAAVIVAAALVGQWQAQRLASAHSRQVGAASLEMQRGMQQQRLHELRVIAGSIANDRAFVGYVAQALQSAVGDAALADTGSVLDLLNERRDQYGFDLAMVLDPAGHVKVDTGAVQVKKDRSLADAQPGVAETLSAGGTGSGVWVENGGLIEVAIAPMQRGAVVEGLLVIGNRLDAARATELAKLSGAETVLLVTTPDGPQVTVSTLDTGTAAALATALGRSIKDTSAADAGGTIGLGIDGDRVNASAMRLGNLPASPWLMSVVTAKQRANTVRDYARAQLLPGAVLLVGMLVLAGVLVRLRP